MRLGYQILTALIFYCTSASANTSTSFLWLKDLNPNPSSLTIIGSLQGGQAMSADGEYIVGSTSKLGTSPFSVEESEPFFARNGVLVGLDVPSPAFFDVDSLIICGDIIYGTLLSIYKQAFRYTFTSGYELTQDRVVACSKDAKTLLQITLSDEYIIKSSPQGLTIQLNKLLPLKYSSLKATSISDDGTKVAGLLYSEGKKAVASFIWTKQNPDELAVIDLSEDAYTLLAGISPSGTHIYGSLRSKNATRSEGFRLSLIDKYLELFSDIPQTDYILDVKAANYNADQILGDSISKIGFKVKRKSFFWSNEVGFRSLKEHLSFVQNNDFHSEKTPTFISAISSNADTIVGNQADYGSYQEFEPWIVKNTNSSQLEMRVITPSFIELGDHKKATIYIQNQGESQVEELKLYLRFPNFLEIKQANLDTHCSRLKDFIVCNWKRISPGASLSTSINFYVKAHGRAYLQAAISSSSLPLNLANNQQVVEIATNGNATEVEVNLDKIETTSAGLSKVKVSAKATSFLGEDLSPGIKWQLFERTAGLVDEFEGNKLELELAKGYYLAVAHVVDESKLKHYSKRLVFALN